MKKAFVVSAPPKVQQPRSVPVTLSLLMGAGVFLIVPIIQSVEAARPTPPQEIDSGEYFPPEPVIKEPPPEDPPPETKVIELPKDPLPLPTLTQLDNFLNASFDGIGVDFGDIAGAWAIGDVMDILDVIDLDKAPNPIIQSQPVYPWDLKKQRIEGTVVIEFVVEADGSVSSPRIIKSSQQQFSDAVLDAVRKWKFEPGMKDGRFVKSRVRLPVPFQLN